MHVIGITGPIGHGKSTLAEALLALEEPSVHVESSELVSAVANEWLATFPKDLLLEDTNYVILNEWLGRLADVVTHQLRPVNASQLKLTLIDVQTQPAYSQKLFVYIDLIRQGVIPLGESINQSNKDRHRAILQWLGGYLVHKADKGIWFEQIEQRLKQAQENGYKLFVVGGIRYLYDAEVIRRNGGIIVELIRADLPEREADDITESEKQLIKVDTTIVSDATPAALKELAQALLHDLMLGDLLPEYNSNDFQPLAE